MGKAPPPPLPTAFLRRCRLRNYRSIESCDLALEKLTLLVGPNGSGKSNLVDALRLVTESLTTSIEHALQERGGVAEVRRRSSGHPRNFAVGLELELTAGPASYEFEVAASQGGFRISRERCEVPGARYELRNGEVVRAEPGPLPATSADRLQLVTASSSPLFRPLYDALSRMGFYNVEPVEIRKLQPPDQGELLARDGRNLASVIRRMQQQGPESLERVHDFLKRVVPGIERVNALPLGHMITLEFQQQVRGARDPWRFQAIGMSDGTLRALAVLVALFQPSIRAGIPLVAIEEPETALHPAAAGVLFDALRSATRHTQVLVTTHSPDLLDHPDLRPEEIRAVSAEQGTTRIGPIDDVSRQAIRDQLTTAGELLRTGQLELFEEAGS